MHKQFLVLLLLSGALSLAAQSSEAGPFSLRISLMDHSTSLPNFWFTRYPFNPAIMVGGAYTLQERPRSAWVVGSNLGFYHDPNLQSAVFLTGELGYRYYLQNWYGSARLGLGYGHAFYPTPTYQVENGSFVANPRTGDPVFMPSLSLEFGYQWRDRPLEPAVFLSFMSAAELPFNFYTGLHQLVGFGFQFNLSKPNS